MFDPVFDPVFGPPDVEAAFCRYEAVRGRLPAARFAARSGVADTLAGVVDHYDAFILDAFGVLNVGETPIAGAVARMRQLRAMGKKLIVLTNAASYPRAVALEKYARLGFDFSEDEVVSSRDAAVSRLPVLPDGGVWGALSAAEDRFADVGVPVLDVIGTDDFAGPGGFLFLSSVRWTERLQARLMAAMRERPRPLIVANPDLVAPREDGLSIEPGWYAHAVLDATGGQAAWFGKPFPDAFADAMARLPGVAPARIAMVGDTLHTDVLGGAAAGIGTILVTAHGLFAGRDVAAYIERSGIRPDHVVRTT